LSASKVELGKKRFRTGTAAVEEFPAAIFSPNLRTGASGCEDLRIELIYEACRRVTGVTGFALGTATSAREQFFRIVCVLCIALICITGALQAAHSHPENSTASHHSCSICASAHAGLNTHVVALSPILQTEILANPVAQTTLIFRALSTEFIRPPPIA
jgi:hypothetical protein